MAEAQGAPRALPADSLRKLHLDKVDAPERVRALMERLRRHQVVLENGLDSAGRLRVAWVERVNSSSLRLRTEGIRSAHSPQFHLSFHLDGSRYSFACVPIGSVGETALEVKLPAAVYRAERRDLRRRRASAETALCFSADGVAVRGELQDSSEAGLGMALRAEDAARLGSEFPVRLLDRSGSPEKLFASVQHRSDDTSRRGWVRLGLRVSKTRAVELLRVDRRETILGGNLPAQGEIEPSKRSEASAGPQRVEIAEYKNAQGRPLRAIVDRAGASVGAPAVVIPPAWGRTKETLLGLAQVLVQAFEEVGKPLVVLRFDGSNRAGESFVAPEHCLPGREHLGFTFSEAISDIGATIDFLKTSADFRSSKVVLLTHSLGAIEARRAVATDSRIDAWISVVGMADLQSGLRAVSGGVDYAFGLSAGLAFGHQELAGVLADMDRTGTDALEHRLVFSEDAKQDMEDIRVPVTWIHGRYDAWVDLGRVQELLSVGDTSSRRLIEIPIGHRLRTSREAYETFQLATEEVSEILLGKRLRAIRVDHARIRRVARAETRRLRDDSGRLREFWKNYLLGRGERAGFELLTCTSNYQAFMAEQVKMLRPQRGQLLLDLGSGIGDFSLFLEREARSASSVDVISLDYVVPALRRARDRLRDAGRNPGPAICADLDPVSGQRVPLASSSLDGVLGSLILSYVQHPAGLMRELYDILRPGGRLVLSTLRRDADISRIYAEGIAELLPDRVREQLGIAHEAEFGRLQQQLLSEAARLLALEDVERFRFYDPGELRVLVESAGLVVDEVAFTFGDPPQAIVVSASRP